MMLPRNYIHVIWDDYQNGWRCWVFHDGQVAQRLHRTDIASVVALAQELHLPVDMGDGQGRLRTALRVAGVRLVP
jgi:hypothetical protein